MQLPGVECVSVSLLTQQATVVYNAAGGTGPRDVLEAIEDVGFEAALAQSGFGDLGGKRNKMLYRYGSTLSCCVDLLMTQSA
jgi:hypothetical protein